MLSRILVYCHFCCVTAQVQERGSLTTLTQCTCQTSAVTLYFSPWLFTHLSPADISDENGPLLCSVATTLIHPCYYQPVSME